MNASAFLRVGAGGLDPKVGDYRDRDPTALIAILEQWPLSAEAAGSDFC